MFFNPDVNKKKQLLHNRNICHQSVSFSEYGKLRKIKLRYSYPLTQESRPQLLGSLSPGVSQTHSIGNSILSFTTDSSL